MKRFIRYKEAPERNEGIVVEYENGERCKYDYYQVRLGATNAYTGIFNDADISPANIALVFHKGRTFCLPLIGNWEMECPPVEKETGK